MIKKVAIIGCQNVGKSTLFDKLNTSSDILNFKNKTRDLKYGLCKVYNSECILIDTPGFVSNINNINNFILLQIWESVNESDLVLMVTDLIFNNFNQKIITELQSFKKNIILIVNKTDIINTGAKIINIAAVKKQFNLRDIIFVSAKYNRNIDKLFSYLFNKIIIDNSLFISNIIKKPVKVIIIGKPNVGKSTFINKILDQNRSIVYYISGTTTDYLQSKIEYKNNNYIFIDTPGIVYENKIHVFESVIIKLINYLNESDIIIIVINAEHGITRKDIVLIKNIINLGKKIIIVINKLDVLSINKKKKLYAMIKIKLSFAKFIKYVFISSLYNKNFTSIFSLIDIIHNTYYKKISLNSLNKHLRKLFINTSFFIKKNIRMKHVCIICYNPLQIIIYGMNTHLILNFYKKYIINSLNKFFNVIGYSIKIKFKNLYNPYILNIN